MRVLQDCPGKPEIDREYLDSGKIREFQSQVGKLIIYSRSDIMGNIVLSIFSVEVCSFHSKLLFELQARIQGEGHGGHDRDPPRSR